LLCNPGVLRRVGDDNVELEPNELRRDISRAIIAAFRPAQVDLDGTILDPAEVAQPLGKGGDPWACGRWRARA